MSAADWYPRWLGFSTLCMCVIDSIWVVHHSPLSYDDTILTWKSHQYKGVTTTADERKAIPNASFPSYAILTSPNIPPYCLPTPLMTSSECTQNKRGSEISSSDAENLHHNWANERGLETFRLTTFYVALFSTPLNVHLNERTPHLVFFGLLIRASRYTIRYPLSSGVKQIF